MTRTEAVERAIREWLARAASIGRADFRQRAIFLLNTLEDLGVRPGAVHTTDTCLELWTYEPDGTRHEWQLWLGALGRVTYTGSICVRETEAAAPGADA